MFSEELKRHAFRSANGEYGWMREQIPEVVTTLNRHECAILGGELWWVRDESANWVGLIPQRKGPDAVYSWDTDRFPTESWVDFVRRGSAEALAAVQKWPGGGRSAGESPGQDTLQPDVGVS